MKIQLTNLVQENKTLLKFSKRVLLFFCLIILVDSLTAQSIKSYSHVSRYSPGETYRSLIDGSRRIENLYIAYTNEKSFNNLQEIRQEFRRLRKLLDLSAVPEASQVKVGNEAIIYLSDILARLPSPNFLEIAETGSNDKWAQASWEINGSEIKISRVDSGPDTGAYLFTSSTISALPEEYARLKKLPLILSRKYISFHQEYVESTGPLFPTWLERRISKGLKNIYLETPIWKFIALALIITGMLITAYIWIVFIKRRIRHSNPIMQLFWKFTLPVNFLIVYYLGVHVLIAHINPVGIIAIGEGLLATAIFYGLAAWVSWVTCLMFAEIIINTSSIASNTIDIHLLRLTARITAICFAGGLLIIGANKIGIPAYGLVTGIGVGGVALALAAQSTLENLFSGIALFSDRPFRIGETIKFNNEIGTVETVGMRSSRIRGLDGTIISIPNSDLAKMKIVNITRRNKFLLLQKFAIHTDTPAYKLLRLLEELRIIAFEDPLVDKSEGGARVRCVAISFGYIALEFRAYILAEDYASFLKVQEKIIIQALEKIQNMEIEIARPFITEETNKPI